MRERGEKEPVVYVCGEEMRERECGGRRRREKPHCTQSTVQFSAPISTAFPLSSFCLPPAPASLLHPACKGVSALGVSVRVE